MTTKEVLQLDCREEESKKQIQKVLRQIKPLSKCSEESDVPLQDIEKALTVMSKKYKMHIARICPDVNSCDTHMVWQATIVNDETLATIQYVYGITLYELFAKCAIAMYSEVRKGIQQR